MGSSMGTRAVVAVALVFAADGALGLARQPSQVVESQLAEYRRVLLAYFRGFDLLPILLPGDDKPGDVFGLRQRGVFRATAGKCFPTLVQPAPVDSGLAYTFLIDPRKAGLAPGLGSVASLKLVKG